MSVKIQLGAPRFYLNRKFVLPFLQCRIFANATHCFKILFIVSCNRREIAQKKVINDLVSTSNCTSFPSVSHSAYFLTRSVFLSVFPCFSHRHARSTLSALRLSKLSRRDETRLSRGAEILPFLFFFFRFISSSQQLDCLGIKAIKKGTAHRWRSARGQFYNPCTFVSPATFCFLFLLFAASRRLKAAILFSNCHVLRIRLSVRLYSNN